MSEGVSDSAEVLALRAALVNLGARVLDTDRFSGIKVGEHGTFIATEDRQFFDFLPQMSDNSPAAGSDA